MSRKLLPILCILALAPIAHSQTDSWLQVRTPHFFVVSNASEKDARIAAHKLEAMRSVFQRVFPEADLDTASPMLVFAVPDMRSIRALEPSDYLGQGQLKLAGLFLYAQERDYILILINAPGNHPYAPIYHEYAH